MENKEKTFNYTYSAKEQEEIKAIRQKYEAPEEDKMAQLRRLDDGVTQKANVTSLIVGVVGALILGCGMSLTMTELGATFGLSENVAMLCGIIIGVVGIAVTALAYPIYNRTLEKERAKIAPEIIRLSDELMK